MYRAIASLAFVLLVLGWTQRRRRRLHVPLVLGGIAIDLAIVVALELQRDVVAQTLHESFDVLATVHIGASSLAVVLYVPTLVLGTLVLRGRGHLLAAHRRVAVSALILRAIGFAFMWGV